VVVRAKRGVLRALCSVLSLLLTAVLNFLRFHLFCKIEYKKLHFFVIKIIRNLEAGRT